MKIDLHGPLLLVPIVSFHFDVISQSDYQQGHVVKNDGDSVSGFVRYTRIKKGVTQCDFKQTMKNKVTIFLPTDLKSYGFICDKRYESINLKVDTIKQSQVFAKVRVKGPLRYWD